MSCIFCKILNEEIPASFVLKNHKVSAFMDVNPINRGHVLVIPNDHHRRFSTIDSDVTGEMFIVAQNILKAIEKSDVKCEGANIFLSDGEIAGQEVLHSHLHIAPRFSGDGHRMGFSRVDTSASERSQLNETAELIKYFYES